MEKVKRFPADYHLHSSFSYDTKHPARVMVEAAIEKRLGEICFTEHKDLDPDFELTKFYKDEPYTREIDRLAGEFESKIFIRKGIEIDYTSRVTGEFEKFLSTNNFDFVLASVHALEGDFVGPKFFKNHDPKTAYRDYFQEVLALSRLTSFDVVGHLDYVKRFGSKKLPLDPQKHEPVLREILENLIKNGKGLELNTAGWRHELGEPYPSPYILRLYREMGGEIVTLGADAHRPADLAYSFDRGISLLSEIGFNGIYVFKARKPEKIFFDSKSRENLLLPN
jgi:histidinol-phosphatase (PHP family)